MKRRWEREKIPGHCIGDGGHHRFRPNHIGDADQGAEDVRLPFYHPT